MAITISGSGSSLPIDSWISQLVQVKQDEIDSISTKKSTVTSQNSALSAVKASYTSLRSALETITDTQFGFSTDVFAKTSATSADTGVVSVSSTSAAVKQSLSVIVSKLATSTTAESTSASPVAKYISDSTTYSALGNGGATTGTLSIYVDGVKKEITIDEDDDTLGKVLDKISTATGLTAEVDAEGKVSISSETSQSIVVGSSSDTSNFVAVTSLQKTDASTYGSSKSIYAVDSTALLTSADAGFASTIQEGSFKIGTATFTIDDTTTLDSLLSQINSSDEANVTAYWDSSAGKMVLTSKEEGAYNINIENIEGNFTDVIGLTTSEYDGEGNVTSSAIKTDSQTLGENAILKINGTQITSNSNTITSDISGITGLTLTLNGVSETATSATKVTVSTDTSALTSALETFVSAYNTALSNTDEATGTDGYLYGETPLNMLRNNIRESVTASVSSSSVFSSLAAIGITTGAVGSSIDADTNQLVIDYTALADALANNPDEVKKLLVGDGTNDGVFTKLETAVESSLDGAYGFFATKAVTYQDEISDFTDLIDKKTEELETYQTDLTNKFSAMDELIAKLNSQYSTFKSILGLD